MELRAAHALIDKGPARQMAQVSLVAFFLARGQLGSVNLDRAKIGLFRPLRTLRHCPRRAAALFFAKCGERERKRTDPDHGTRDSEGDFDRFTHVFFVSLTRGPVLPMPRAEAM